MIYCTILFTLSVQSDKIFKHESIFTKFKENKVLYYGSAVVTGMAIGFAVKHGLKVKKISIIPCLGDLDNNSTTIESDSDIYYHNSK